MDGLDGGGLLGNEVGRGLGEPAPELDALVLRPAPHQLQRIRPRFEVLNRRRVVHVPSSRCTEHN